MLAFLSPPVILSVGCCNSFQLCASKNPAIFAPLSLYPFDDSMSRIFFAISRLFFLAYLSHFVIYCSRVCAKQQRILPMLRIPNRQKSAATTDIIRHFSSENAYPCTVTNLFHSFPPHIFSDSPEWNKAIRVFPKGEVFMLPSRPKAVLISLVASYLLSALLLFILTFVLYRLKLEGVARLHPRSMPSMPSPASRAGCSAAKRCITRRFFLGLHRVLWIFWRSLRHPFCCATGRVPELSPDAPGNWLAARQEAAGRRNLS